MKRDKFFIAVIILVVLIVLVAVGIFYKLGVFDKSDKRYNIYVYTTLDNKSEDLTDYLECTLPTEAKAGETVTFTVKSKSASYAIANVSYMSESQFVDEFLTATDGVYSFVMPDEYVEIFVSLKTVAEQLYSLQWQRINYSDIPAESLIECILPSKVKAGETVSFTIKVLNPAYEILGVWLFEGDMASPQIPCENGVYTFIMPAADAQVLIAISEVDE